MKDFFLILSIFILTVTFGYLMLYSESLKDEVSNNKENQQHKYAKKKIEDVSKNKKCKVSEFEVRNEKDIQKIMYSNKNEVTKMKAYNQAVDKGIIPRSNNYQFALNAYEESVWLKNNGY